MKFIGYLFCMCSVFGAPNRRYQLRPNSQQEPQPRYGGQQRKRYVDLPHSRRLTARSLALPPVELAWFAQDPETLVSSSKMLRMLASMRSSNVTSELRYVTAIVASSFILQSWLMDILLKLETILMERRAWDNSVQKFKHFLNGYLPSPYWSEMDSSDFMHDLIFDKLRSFVSKFYKFLKAYKSLLVCDEADYPKINVTCEVIKSALKEVKTSEATDFLALNRIADGLHGAALEGTNTLKQIFESAYYAHYGTNAPPLTLPRFDDPSMHSLAASML